VHGWDLTLGPVAALIGAVVPDAALAHLTAFAGERTVERRISDPDEGDRVATAWLGPDVALGAERGTVDLSWWEQFHATTAHWRRDDGTSGWLRAVVPGPSDATVEAGRLTLRWHHGPADRDGAGGLARFELAGPLSDADPITLSTDGAPLEPSGPGSLQAGPGDGDVTIFTIEAR
jgi:hypothetical protein